MLNPNIQERASAFLLSKLKELDAQTAADLAEGKLKIFSKKHYLRAEILNTADGNTIIGKGANQRKLRGVASYAYSQLDKGEYFALVGIGIGYVHTTGLGAIGTDAADGLDPARAGIYSPYTLDPATLGQRVPTGLVNRDISFLNRNQEIYSGPVTPFFIRGAVGNTNTSNQDHIVELEAPKLIEPETDLIITLHAEPGVTIGNNPLSAAARQFISVNLFGVGFKKAV